MSKRTQKIAVLGNRFGIESVTKLRGIIGKFKHDYTTLLGQGSLNDGKAVEYYWDENSTVADDNDLYIKPDGIVGAGRWRKVLKNNQTIPALPRQKVIVQIFSSASDSLQITNPFGTKHLIIQVTKEVIKNTQSYNKVIEVAAFVGNGLIIIESAVPFDQNIEYTIFLQEIV